MKNKLFFYILFQIRNYFFMAQFLDIEVITGDATINYGDGLNIIDASGGNITITLPDTKDKESSGFFIKRRDTSSNTVTIVGTSSQTIDGKSSFSLDPNYSIEIYVVGSNWNVISSHILGATGATGVTGATGATGYSMSMGEIFFESSSEHSTGNLSLNTAFEMVPGTTLKQSTSGIFDMPSNGRLRYLGATTTTFHVSFSLSARSLSGSNQNYLFQVRQNGSVITGAGYKQTLQSASTYAGGSSTKLVTLAQNDYLSFFVTNLTSTVGLSIYSLRINVIG